jgi:preprotein translocase subunit YajC
VIQDFWANAVFSVVPTILIGLIFWFIMRSILRADRTERETLKKYEAEERERRGLPPKND